ncbi:MAG: hypothetical protein HC843_07520 [Sphingomonadales bacterium]|nr:hypothetical protein [Sphingomonadales bacterium]
MKSVSAVAAAIILAALAGCTANSAVRTPLSAASSSVEQSIIDQMTKVADWQLAHMTSENYAIRKPSRQTWVTRGGLWALSMSVLRTRLMLWKGQIMTRR